MGLGGQQGRLASRRIAPAHAGSPGAGTRGPFELRQERLEPLLLPGERCEHADHRAAILEPVRPGERLPERLDRLVRPGPITQFRGQRQQRRRVVRRGPRGSSHRVQAGLLVAGSQGDLRQQRQRAGVVRAGGDDRAGGSLSLLQPTQSKLDPGETRQGIDPPGRVEIGEPAERVGGFGESSAAFPQARQRHPCLGGLRGEIDRERGGSVRPGEIACGLTVRRQLQGEGSVLRIVGDGALQLGDAVGQGAGGPVDRHGGGERHASALRGLGERLGLEDLSVGRLGLARFGEERRERQSVGEVQFARGRVVGTGLFSIERVRLQGRSDGPVVVLKVRQHDRQPSQRTDGPPLPGRRPRPGFKRRLGPAEFVQILAQRLPAADVVRVRGGGSLVERHGGVRGVRLTQPVRHG
ncbi:hypothetical protein LzC2_38880 [Planctomycetes bacterium LzC2]|uniref:Uncharacterized protein n=1 Tax=Alienimonas chondri TaxID=2681879 RepID=A0ABX1VI30_9PLAN|nr:hypothetical protein [Alienimonas chondri]